MYYLYILGAAGYWYLDPQGVFDTRRSWALDLDRHKDIDTYMNIDVELYTERDPQGLLQSPFAQASGEALKLGFAKAGLGSRDPNTVDSRKMECGPGRFILAFLLL